MTDPSEIIYSRPGATRSLDVAVCKRPGRYSRNIQVQISRKDAESEEWRMWQINLSFTDARRMAESILEAIGPGGPDPRPALAPSEPLESKTTHPCIPKMNADCVIRKPGTPRGRVAP